MLSQLQKIYEYSSDRLKYAEGKNGALLAVAALTLFRLLDSKELQQADTKYIFLAGLIFFALTILICILSFIAKFNIPKMLRHGLKQVPANYSQFNNLLSSIRVAYYTPEEYAELMTKKLGLEKHESNELEKDYIEHIIVNSKIVIFKFNCFRWATFLMLLGMACALIVKFANVI